MLSNSYIKMSYAFTIIGFTAESTLKFINDTRCKFLENTIFKDLRVGVKLRLLKLINRGVLIRCKVGEVLKNIGKLINVPLLLSTPE